MRSARASFVLAGEQADGGPLGALVVLEGDLAVHVDDLIAPGRHVTMMLRLARIEVRRDVAVRPAPSR
jgi:hypothetical protein